MAGRSGRGARMPARVASAAHRSPARPPFRTRATPRRASGPARIHRLASISAPESVMSALELDPATTALILIDLQRGIVSRPTAPHAAAEVVRRGAALAAACRARGMLVVLVRVAF